MICYTSTAYRGMVELFTVLINTDRDLTVLVLESISYLCATFYFLSSKHRCVELAGLLVMPQLMDVCLL